MTNVKLHIVQGICLLDNDPSGSFDYDPEGSYRQHTSHGRRKDNKKTRKYVRAYGSRNLERLACELRVRIHDADFANLKESIE